jgi:hypothetical protein
MTYAISFTAFAFVFVLLGQVNALKKRVAALEARLEQSQEPK